VALFNHSGQQDKALHAPIPISDIRISLRPQKSVKTVRLLQTGSTLAFSQDSKGLAVVVPKLDHYEIVLFEYTE
jgi:hypothetical protein